MRAFNRLIVAFFVIFAVSAATARFPRGGGAGFSTDGVIINAASTQYYMDYTPYLNWWLTASPTEIVSSTNGTLDDVAVWQNGTYLDPATGDLKIPAPADTVSFGRHVVYPALYAQYQYSQTSFNHWNGEVFTVKWDGCANPTVTIGGGGVGAGGSSGPFANNTGTFTLGSSSSYSVDLLFTLTSLCYADPPRNIRVYQARYATNVTNGEQTNPDWRAVVSGFGAIRLMDLTSTNNTGITDSSQLASTTYSYRTAGLGMVWDAGASISGTTLTISSGANLGVNTFQVGQALVGAGVPAGRTITGSALTSPGLCSPNCTGTGGVGTYAISGGSLSVSGVIMGVPSVGGAGASAYYGPKSGISPAVACAIANETGTPIEYPIPVAATNQFVDDVATALRACTTQRVDYSYSNENFNPGFFQYYYCIVMAPTVGLASGMQYSGYRAAQIFDRIYAVYGQASNTGRWRGKLGSQLANPGLTPEVIIGAQAAVSGLGLHPLTQLAYSINVAPYYGPHLTGNTITNITASATPTVTITGTNSFTNGQAIKLFVGGGTMAAALNNQYATVSGVSGQTFQINISTAGLTYGGSVNVAADATWFKLADQSAALNTSTPSTYPTPFSYFAQQVSKSILTGSATDVSYGTLVTDPTYSYASNGIPDYLAQHALIASINGLRLGQYEGGPGMQMDQPIQGNPPAQLVNYLTNWHFDAGVVGDSTNTVGGVFAAAWAAQCNLATNYGSNLSQFTDAGAQSQFGPWGALRYIAASPGDTANPHWLAVKQVNSYGNCIDPTPAPVATLTVLPSFSTSSSTSAQSFSSSIGTAATYVVVSVFSQNNPTVTSVTVDGTTLNLDAGSTGYAKIYSGAVPSGSASRTIAINWVGASFFQRGANVYKITNIQQASPRTVAEGSSSSSVTITESRNAIMIVQGNCNVGTVANSFSASSYAPTSNSNDPTGFGVGGYWNLNVPFSSSKFAMTASASSCPTMVGATYN